MQYFEIPRHSQTKPYTYICYHRLSIPGYSSENVHCRSFANMPYQGKIIPKNPDSAYVLFCLDM